RFPEDALEIGRPDLQVARRGRHVGLERRRLPKSHDRLAGSRRGIDGVIDRAAAFEGGHFPSSASAVVTGGTVFGISAMVVTPPIAADLVPLAKSSLCVSPGSLMWTWRSTAPGRISASPWSIDSSARRVFRTAAILPSSSIPTLSGSRRPRYQTRPLMTRTRRLHLPAHD